MPTKRLTAKAFADFVTASPARKRTILKNCKYPKKKESQIITLYYNEALRIIRSYHQHANDPAVINQATRRLRLEQENAESTQKKIRLSHNIRAIETYLQVFGGNKFTVLPRPRLKLSVGDILISASPDLAVNEKGNLKLIKLGVVTQRLPPDLIAIMLQVILDAAIAAGIHVNAENVQYLDIARAEILRPPRDEITSRRTIENGCEDIQSLWGSL